MQATPVHLNALQIQAYRLCIGPRTPKNHKKTIFACTFTETWEQFNSRNTIISTTG